MESCSSVRNSGLWPGGFVLCGLWGQWGASTGTFTKHEVTRDGECRISCYAYASLALEFYYFPISESAQSDIYTHTDGILFCGVQK